MLEKRIKNPLEGRVGQSLDSSIPALLMSMKILVGFLQLAKYLENFEMDCISLLRLP